MSKDEQAIEAEIQAKGLNAPRLSPEEIDAVIAGEDIVARRQEVQGRHRSGVREEPDQPEQPTRDATALVRQQVPGASGTGDAGQAGSGGL